MHQCSHCKVFRYKMSSQYHGHLRHCPAINLQQNMPDYNNLPLAFNDLANILENIDAEINPDVSSDENFTDDALLLIVHEAREHLQRQDLFRDAATVEYLKAGYPLLLDGNRKKADIRIYLEIARFISACYMLSKNECDNLLDMLKKITHINGKEIPIPARYSTIIANILSSTESLRSSIIQSTFPLSKEIFNVPEVYRQLPQAVGVASNILHILGN